MSKHSEPVFRSMVGLWARDFRVLRRDWLPFALRTVMNPLLTVFVFTYVLPRSGNSLPTSNGATSYATVLIPGLIALAMVFTAVSAVAMPLAIELGATREIEDRVLAPVPMGTVPIAKIAFGAFQGILAGLMIFPIIVSLPATEVHINIASPLILILVLIMASWTAAALGLFLGTAIRPQHIGLMFALVLSPITFLGCVYYPWAALSAIPWLKTIVLINPLVYMSEGLRIALTPDLPHMPVIAVMIMLAAIGAALTVAGVRGFIRRVVS